MDELEKEKEEIKQKEAENPDDLSLKAEAEALEKLDRDMEFFNRILSSREIPSNMDLNKEFEGVFDDLNNPALSSDSEAVKVTKGKFQESLGKVLESKDPDVRSVLTKDNQEKAKTIMEAGSYVDESIAAKEIEEKKLASGELEQAGNGETKEASKSTSCLDTLRENSNYGEGLDADHTDEADKKATDNSWMAATAKQGGR